MTAPLPLNLAANIRTEHEAAQASARDAVAHAIRCGEMLAEVKASLPHGELGAWLAVNVPFSDRTARGYMRLAGLDDATRQRVADMSLRTALQSLATPRETTPAATLEDDIPTLSRAQLMTMPIEEMNQHRRRCLEIATRAMQRILDERDIPAAPEIPRAHAILKDCDRMLINIGAASPPGQHGLALMALSQCDEIARMLVRHLGARHDDPPRACPA